jgi:hypothetical protein
MTIIRNRFEVFLVASKNQGNEKLGYLYIPIKQSRVSYAIYNSRTAGQICMIFILLDLSPPRLAE